MQILLNIHPPIINITKRVTPQSSNVLASEHTGEGEASKSMSFAQSQTSILWFYIGALSSFSYFLWAGVGKGWVRGGDRVQKPRREKKN